MAKITSIQVPHKKDNELCTNVLSMFMQTNL